MAQEMCCLQCGARIPVDAVEGLCPQCLMQGAIRAGAAAGVESTARIDGPGTVLGRYELLELIGEGGMGLVYLAEQKEPVRRQAALKILKPGMDSRQVIARFEAERQALVLLDHPHIAHVLDAGCTETGRPYFVMEYVRGLSITRYCDDNRLTIEQRLRLFEQVCEAVHHAHQKGIIHRDLKPSNILVSVQGDQAVPKIIDFGIAKAITQPLTDQTCVTFQGQLLGTPEYMSPEQVDLPAQDIDTRSDIYSLGVVLYELLAGVLPFESELFERAGLAQIQQTIREQEPACPSLRLACLGEKAKTIAARRGTQVVPLARRLHRELEWIPLKALRKDRCRRYKSAAEMAADIRNYLHGNPLLAGPETAVYRVQKFVRRHAGSVTAAALVVLAILLGLGTSTTMYAKAEGARQEEATARQAAEQARLRAEQAEKVAQEQRGLVERHAEDYRRALYANSIQLADAKYREGDIRQVRRLLDACPNDLRGWEWNRLTHIEDQSMMSFVAHPGRVNSLALTPDGKQIVTAGWGQTIKVWDTSSGATLLHLLPGNDKEIRCVALSPDGQRILAGDDLGQISMWDRATGRHERTLKASANAVLSIAFSPDGRRFVSGGYRDTGTLRVWDVASGSEVSSIRAQARGGVFGVAFSPDGKKIVSVGNVHEGDGNVRVWDAATGRELTALTGMRPVVFGPDGQLAAAGGHNDINLWDPVTGRRIMSLRGHEGPIDAIAFSSDGKYVVSAGMDNTIEVWDVSTGATLLTLRGHKGFVVCLAFTPDGERIVSGSWDGSVKIWDLTVNRALTSLVGHDSMVSSVVYSPDGKRIASRSSSGVIKLWDPEKGAEMMTLHHGAMGLGTYSVAFSPDGRHIAARCWGLDRCRIWDAATGVQVKAIGGHEEHAGGVRPGVGAIAFSPDGKYIVTGGRGDKTVKVWDVAAGTEVMSVSADKNGVICVAFSPDGKRIVSGCRDRTVRVWDATNGAELLTLRAGSGVGRVTFSPDGRTIACATWDKTIQLWESAPPANGYESRRTGVVARRMVDQMYAKHGSYHEVVSSLRGDAALEESVRKLAIQIANSRIWEDAEKLKKEAWETVCPRDKDLPVYQAALAQARKADGWEPNDPVILRAVAAAQYRTAACEDASRTLARAAKLRAGAGDEADPPALAFAAMALHRLGRSAEATVSLEQLRGALKDERFAEDEEAKALLAEAETLLGGEKP